MMDISIPYYEDLSRELISLGYPVSTNGNIPTYEETFNICKEAVKHRILELLSERRSMYNDTGYVGQEYDDIIEEVKKL